MNRPWYKHAFVYELDVSRFQDGDGDGVGDFLGLVSRLDYLAGIGVTCVWLLPFYPTPNRDNRYDVAHYTEVAPELGTLADFVEFIREARSRGIRVVVDLVMNHTSIDHPWFRSARSDPASPYRDYYLWSEEPPERPRIEPIFPGVEDDVWSYDEEAGAYYFHRFYAHEPDLNVANPAVEEEMLRVMAFWLQLGVDGFRIDAASHIVAKADAAGGDGHALLRRLRDFASGRKGDAVLLAEADVEPRDLQPYFGEGDEVQVLLNFLVANYVFLALAREDAEPVARALRMLPRKPATGQWGLFLRNHDELDLERLAESEREEVFAAFAPDEDMQVYGRGIRRRLAPMLGDDARVRLALSLLFTLPGTPVLLYGDEIGMGEDLRRPERESVRLPMQWSSGAVGGFSSAAGEALASAAVADGAYGYERVNVLAQERDAGSLLNWFERALRLRRQCPEIGDGRAAVLEPHAPSVLAHRVDDPHGTVFVALHNLAGEEVSFALDEIDDVRDLVAVFPDARPARVESLAAGVTLGPHEYRWLRRPSL